MPDYKQGKIYKIVCNVTGKVYIGSTIETIARRLAGHRRAYKTFKEGKSPNVTSYQIIEQGNYDIVLIETCPCESKDELHRRERYFIESLDCVNKIIPTRTYKEYCLDNKDAIKEKAKRYQQDNKDVLRERRNQWRIDNIEKTKQWRIDNIEKTKQYRIDNREKTKQYGIDNQEKKKQYRIDNREAIKETAKQYRLNNKDAMNERQRVYRMKRKTETSP